MEEVSKIVNQSHWLSPVNPLLEISKYMSVNECRIFYVALMAMRQNLMEDRNLPMLLLPTGELLKMFGGNKGYYREIKNITARLAERQIRFNQKLYPLFDSIGFQSDKGGLYMLFCHRLRPLMVEMSSRDYLPVVAAAVFNLGSTYAIRLLELMLQYHRLPQFAETGQIRIAFSLESFKTSLNIPDTATYSQISNIRHKILNSAMEDINSHTQFSLSYQMMKTGRKVTGIMLYLSLPRHIPPKGIQNHGAREADNLLSADHSTPNKATKG